ncbi:hypothetical protein GWI33_016917 [Rhynchophorus ferrugineus]|uniref:Uncharacterized protein n=1 Tax=Rhynchophorus ferrugineus TaxID=354439 RepID=A0A834M6P3_RHYFE|nr:hypothetical protein GWI33_016917 [Rhynchophorus ferrugineus]
MEPICAYAKTGDALNRPTLVFWLSIVPNANRNNRIGYPVRSEGRREIEAALTDSRSRPCAARPLEIHPRRNAASKSKTRRNRSSPGRRPGRPMGEGGSRVLRFTACRDFRAGPGRCS